MIYFIENGIRPEQYHVATFSASSVLLLIPYRLQGFIEKVGLYHLSVFPTVSLKYRLHSRLLAVTRGLAERQRGKVP